MIPSWFPSYQLEGLQHYHDFHKVAAGRYGEVYIARGEGEKVVAVKRLKPQEAKDPSIRSSFEREARLLKKLNHPQIPRFIDGYLSDEECFFIMEFIPGQSAHQLIAQAKASGVRFPLELAFEIMFQGCEALSYLHGYRDGSGEPHPIIHCDLKPKNLMITPDIQSILIDFSLAVLSSSGESHAGGTHRYMPPERFAGMSPTPQTDLFSLVATFYEIITLRPLVSETKTSQIFGNFLSKKYLLRIHEENFPEPIERFLLKGLALQPEDRFQNAEELMKTLQECVQKMVLNLEKPHLKNLFALVSKVS